MSEPYRDAASLYWQAGWRGILPLPPKSKKLTLRGYTGHNGAEPSYADIQAWVDGDEGSGNIALRLSDNVIGIDVDAYGDKRGATTMLDRERDWSPLPDTWRSSARDGDDVSGIHWYRVPPGLAWPGEIGPHVELIQRAHRYAVVWPSIHPDTGTRYQWYSPSGEAQPFVVPRAEEFAELPASWVHGLSTGIYTPQSKAGVTDQRVETFIASVNRVGTCRMVRHAVSEISTRFRHGGSRHEALNAGVLTLVRYGEQGHRGLSVALAELHAAFTDAATDPGRGAARSDGAAAGEWARAVAGAVALVLANPTSATPAEPCLCDAPLTDLVPPSHLDDGRPRPKPRNDRVVSPGHAQNDSGGMTTPVKDESGSAEPLGGNADISAGGPDLSALIDIEMMRQRVRRAATRALDLEEASGALTWPASTFSVAEELELPDAPITYTVAHVMPSGSNVLLAAQFKSGKTTLVNNLARSLADGTPFLGKFQMSALTGRVAIWNYEVGRDMYRRWLRDVQIGNADRVSLLNLRGHRLPLMVPSVQDRVVAWLQEHDIALWIVDPFARAFVGSGKENDNDDVGAFLDTIDVIKERAGVADHLLVTHTGRAEMTEGQERARGATRLDDWADVRWILTRDAHGAAFFRATGRDVEWPESQLAYEDATRTLTMNEKSRSELRSDEMMTAICAVARRSPGISARALRDEVKDLLGSMSVKNFEHARGVLRRNGTLKTEVSGSAVGHYLADPGDLGTGSQ